MLLLEVCQLRMQPLHIKEGIMPTQCSLEWSFSDWVTMAGACCQLGTAGHVLLWSQACAAQPIRQFAVMHDNGPPQPQSSNQRPKQPFGCGMIMHISAPLTSTPLDLSCRASLAASSLSTWALSLACSQVPQQ